MGTETSRRMYWIRLVVSVVLILLLFMQMDTDALYSALGSVPIWYFFAGGLLYATLQLITAVKLWVLVPEVPLQGLIRTTFATQHIVFLLPSVVTLDLARSYAIRKEILSVAKYAAAVLVDKVIGLLVITGLIGAVSVMDRTIADVLGTMGSPVNVWAMAVWIGSSAAILLLFTPLGVLLGRIAIQFLRSVLPRLGLVQLLEQALVGIESVTSSPSRLALNVLLSILFQAGTALAFSLLGYVFGLGVSFEQYLWICAIMQVASFVPLSFAGIGFKDVTFVATMGLFGVRQELSMAASLAGYPVVIVFAVLGWLLSSVHRKRVDHDS